jgi:hypothetical protein
MVPPLRTEAPTVTAPGEPAQPKQVHQPQAEWARAGLPRAGGSLPRAFEGPDPNLSWDTGT